MEHALRRQWTERLLHRAEATSKPVIKVLTVVDDAGVFQLAAAIAFYALLALGPLMLVILSVVGFVFADDAVNGRVYAALRELTGPEAAGFVEEIVRRSAGKGQGLAAIFGGLMFMWTASGVFGQLSVALANVRRVAIGQLPLPPSQATAALSRWRQLAHGGWHFARERLLSLAMIGVAAALLVLSLVASSIITVMTSTFDRWLDLSWTVSLANVVVSFILFAALSAALYRLLARPALPRGSAIRGGLVAAGLFLVGRSIFAMVVPLAASESSYGPATSVITVLLWAWFSAMTLLIGCAVGAVHAETVAQEQALARAKGAAAP